MAADRLAASLPPDPHVWVNELGKVLVRGQCVLEVQVFVCERCRDISFLDPKLTHPLTRKPCKEKADA
jgi:hypothetical protein